MENDTSSAVGALGSLLIMLVTLGIALAVYLFFCYCFKRICEKAGHEPGILIWIPIAQIIPMLQVAKLPIWLIVLFFIPFVNVVVGVWMWAKICEARGKSPWLVVLLLIPIVNIAFIPYLAFSE